MPCFVIQEHAFNPFIAQIVSEGMHLLWGYQKGKKKLLHLFPGELSKFWLVSLKTNQKKSSSERELAVLILCSWKFRLEFQNFWEKRDDLLWVHSCSYAIWCHSSNQVQSLELFIRLRRKLRLFKVLIILAISSVAFIPVWGFIVELLPKTWRVSFKVQLLCSFYPVSPCWLMPMRKVNSCFWVARYVLRWISD